MDANETAKLSPSQLTLLFTLALPLVAVPALYIFIVAPDLFDKYETSKLVLLGFAISSPIFAVTWGGTVLHDLINKGYSSKEIMKDAANYITAASFITVVFYALFIMVALWGSQNSRPDPRTALLLPFGVGTVGMVLVVGWRALRPRKKKS